MQGSYPNQYGRNPKKKNTNGKKKRNRKKKPEKTVGEIKLMKPRSVKASPTLLKKNNVVAESRIMLKKRGKEPGETCFLIDEEMKFVEIDEVSHLFAHDDCLEYQVVAAVGRSFVGKSTILNTLMGGMSVFKTQSMEKYLDTGMAQTVGIDISVTADRVILLDCQPFFSSARLVSWYEKNGKHSPSRKREELKEYKRCLQLAVFLFTICDTVLVIQEERRDEFLWEFVRCAQILAKNGARIFPVFNKTEEERRDGLCLADGEDPNMYFAPKLREKVLNEIDNGKKSINWKEWPKRALQEWNNVERSEFVEEFINLAHFYKLGHGVFRAK